MKIEGKSPPPFEPKKIIEKTNKSENKALDTLKQIGISATRLLPFSSRGIVINILKAPIRLCQSIGRGIQAVRNNKLSENNQSFGTVFKENLIKLLKKDWIGGISDYYTRLDEKSKNTNKIYEHKKYFSAMSEDVDDLHYFDIKPLVYESSIDNGLLKNLHSKFTDLGFKQALIDGSISTNNYYNEKTGTCFKLSKIDNEVIVTFVG